MRILSYSILSVLLVPVFLATPAFSQSSWSDDLQRYSPTLKVEAPQGYQEFPTPGGNGGARNHPGATTLELVGFVEKSGVRYYLTVQAQDRWFDTGGEPSWVVITGGGVFPEKPPLLSRGPGTDPDTGEEVTIELYEETVQLANQVTWPLPVSETVDVVLPLKVKSSADLGGGKWNAVFTVYPNFDSNIGKFGFATPSFKQMSSGTEQVRRMLFSKPSAREFTVTGNSQGPRIASVLKPGVMFNGSFRGGKLFRLKAGDIWPAIVASSRFSPPAFRKVLGQMQFHVQATTLDGGQVGLDFVPDKILGADFTDYNLIAQMGPPFDDQQGFPEWTMSEWSIVVRSDQTIRMVAPLMEGRGAAGMLELESLELGPGYEEEIELMKTFYERLPNPVPVPPGMQSILKSKLGPVPDSMKISPEEQAAQMGGF